MAVFAYFVFISCCILLIDATEVAEVAAESRAVFDPNWQINGSFVWADGCGFPGNDINANGLPKRKKEECGTSCLNNPQCDRFSWNTAGNCYHKKWSKTVAAARTGFRCGFIPTRAWNVDGNSKWADNCDFKDQNLKNYFPTNSIEACSQKCFDVPECDHFTLLDQSYCLLKKGQWVDNKPTMSNAQCGYIPGRSWTAVDAKGVTWKDNCDFQGKELAIALNPIPNITPEDCGTRCLNEQSCDHFTWWAGDSNKKNLCYLKKGSWPENAPSPLPNARCGFIFTRSWNVEGNSLWDSNCKFDEHDFAGGFLTTNSIQECSSKCSANSECVYFNWYKKSNSCNLMAGKSLGNKQPPTDPDSVRCGYMPRRL